MDYLKYGEAGVKSIGGVMKDIKSLDIGYGLNLYRDIPMVVAMDLDGVLFNYDGEPNDMWILWSRVMQKLGIKVVLWTCRVELDMWLEKLKEREFVPDKVNANIDEVVRNYPSEGRKIFAHLYLDDQMIGFSKLTPYDIMDEILKYRNGMEYYAEEK